MHTEGPWRVDSARGLGEYPEDGCIDVWMCTCSAPIRVLRGYLETFDEMEKTRAASFRAESAWSTFVARRAMVRAISSRYLGVPCDSFTWETGPLGKPFLRTEAGDGRLEFSWSQAGTMVAVAVARGIPVGVDACLDSDAKSLDGLARVFCSEDEVSALERLPEAERTRAFMQCWIGKEACLKAAGTGLRCDPRRLRIWGNAEYLDRVEWNDGVDASSKWQMAIAYRAATQGTTLAVAAPVPLALTKHRLVWNGGDNHGFE